MSGSSWRELFRGERAIFVIVLNLGIGLHAIDVFVISTIMPEVIEDIGGISVSYTHLTLPTNREV